MTEIPSSSVEPTAEAKRARDDDRTKETSRVVHVAAWTGIVAGVVLSVAAIFFSGFFLGWSSGSHYGWHRGHDAGMDHSCSMNGQMKGSGGMVGPEGPNVPPQMRTTTPLAPPSP